ncbi:MAG: hypothetical protein R3F43_17095 [bacterium]
MGSRALRPRLHPAEVVALADAIDAGPDAVVGRAPAGPDHRGPPAAVVVGAIDAETLAIGFTAEAGGPVAPGDWSPLPRAAGDPPDQHPRPAERPPVQPRRQPRPRPHHGGGRHHLHPRPRPGGRRARHRRRHRRPRRGRRLRTRRRPPPGREPAGLHARHLPDRIDFAVAFSAR